MRVKNSIKNISTGLIGQMVVLLTSFVSRTIFIKILGSTYLGVSGLFSNILSLLSLAELGIGQAITYSLYKPIADGDKEKIKSLMAVYKKLYFYIFLFVLIVGSSLTPFLQYIISDIDRIPHIRLIYMMYVIKSATSYLFIYRTTLITASQKNFITHQLAYFFSFAMMILEIVSLILFKNYLIYLGIQIGTVIAQNITTAIIAGKMFPELKEKKIKKLEGEEKGELTKNIKSLMIYKVGTLALNSTDNILISTFAGIIKVGLYSNYHLITTSVTGFLSTIFGNLTASIGNLNAVETNEKKTEMFNIINLATFWLYGVAAICIFCVANPFINLWIGKDYLLPYSDLFIIVLNAYVAGMLFAPFNYRQTMGLFVYGKMRPIISAVINIVASILLGQKFGLVGVLWGTIIARGTTNVWFDPYIVFKKGLNSSPVPYYLDYILKLIILFATGMVSFCLSNLIPGDGFVSVLAKAMISFVFVNIIFAIVYGRSKEFSYLISTVKRIFKKKKA